MRLVNFRTLVVGVAGFGLAACGDDIVVQQPPPVISVNPGAVNCTVGQTQAIAASVSSQQQGATFSFASNNANVTVAAQGNGAVLTCAAVGSSIVTVTYAGQTFSVPVNVTAAPSGVTAIQITGGGTVAVGGTTTLTATVLGAPGVNTAVRFAANPTSIATVDSLTGVVRGVAPGVATITARSVASPNIQAAVPLTVVAADAFVQSISASPTNVALQPGATQQITANVTLAVNAPAGTSRGATFTSSDTSIARVSSTGLITAGSREGTATITVASQAAPTIATQVTVTVRQPAPVRLSIASVTNPNVNLVIDPSSPIGTTVPQAPAGQPQNPNATNVIVANLNLDPGDARISRVEVFLGDTSNVVCRQTFSAALSDAYRNAIQTGSADVQPIACPINVAAFDTLTGRTFIRNGAAALGARVFGTFPGGSQTAQIANFAGLQTFNIQNVSGFFARVTNTPSADQAAVNPSGRASDPNGRLFLAGSLTVSVVPVSFDTAQTTNVPGSTITVTLQDDNFVRTLTATAAATGFTTVTFPGQTATGPGEGRSQNAAPGNIDGVTSDATGTVIQINGVTSGLGANNVLGTNGVPGARTVNLDNQAPQPAVTFGFSNANFTTTDVGTGAAVGFINGAFTFGGANGFRPNFLSVANNPASATTTANPDFGGVDRVTTTFFASTASQVSGTITSGGTRAATGADLAPANQNTFGNGGYTAAVQLTDALGNRRNQTVVGGTNVLNGNGTGITTQAGFITFGVDLSPPTLVQASGLTEDVIDSTSAAKTYQFAVQDDIGPGANPVLLSIRRTARATTGTGVDAAGNALNSFCATSVSAAGVITFGAATTAACTAVATTGLVTIPAGGANGANGEFTITATGRDQAGNQSGSITRRVHNDDENPVVGGISLPQTLQGNQPVTFTTAATDNLELGSAFGELDYGTVASLRYFNNRVQLGTAFDNVFTNSINAIAITIPNFIRSVTTTTGAGGAITGPAQIATFFRPNVRDVAGNETEGAIAIPTANIAGTTTTFTSANPATNVSGVVLEAFTGTAAASNTLALNTTTTTPGTFTSGTIQLRVTGAAGALVSPFTRIELYVQTGTTVAGPAGAPAGTPQYEFLGTVPAGFVTDLAGVRTITSRFTLGLTTSPLITAPAAAGTNTFNVIALLVAPNGDAVITQPITVTITNP